MNKGSSVVTCFLGIHQRFKIGDQTRVGSNMQNGRKLVATANSCQKLLGEVTLKVHPIYGPRIVNIRPVMVLAAPGQQQGISSFHTQALRPQLYHATSTGTANE